MKLKIKETAWGIHRMAWGYRESVIPDFGKGKRHFTVDEVTENSICFSVHCVDPRYNKTWILKKGEEITYRPRSFDGGYFYNVKLI